MIPIVVALVGALGTIANGLKKNLKKARTIISVKLLHMEQHTYSEGTIV